MGGIPSIYPSPYSDVGEGSFRELKVRSNFRAYELGGGIWRYRRNDCVSFNEIEPGEMFRTNAIKIGDITRIAGGEGVIMENSEPPPRGFSVR